MIIEESVDDEEYGVSIVLILSLGIGSGVAMEVLTEFGERHSFEWIEKGVSAKWVIVFIERRLRSNCVVNRSGSDA